MSRTKQAYEVSLMVAWMRANRGDIVHKIKLKSEEKFPPKRKTYIKETSEEVKELGS
jgi:hypothetical protein